MPMSNVINYKHKKTSYLQAKHELGDAMRNILHQHKFLFLEWGKNNSEHQKRLKKMSGKQC